MKLFTVRKLSQVVLAVVGLVLIITLGAPANAATPASSSTTAATGNAQVSAAEHTVAGARVARRKHKAHRAHRPRRARCARVHGRRAKAVCRRGHTPAKHAPTGPAGSFTYVGGDDFNANTVDTGKWGLYNGVPGCCPDTLWNSSRVAENGGALQVWNQKDASGRWLSGGTMATAPYATQKYGMFESRLKFSAGAGTSAAALLWPTSGWPPEIDFYEIGSDWATRAQMMMTTHWNSNNRMSQRFINNDFTQWHTVRVVWTPTVLDYYLDGQLMKHDTDPAMIPDVPMTPAFQVHVLKDTAGNLPTQNSTLSVDYLKVWKYNA